MPFLWFLWRRSPKPLPGPWLSPTLNCLLFLGCGFLYSSIFYQLPLPYHHVGHLIRHRQEVSLTGRLVQKPTYRQDKTQIILDSQALLLPTASVPVPATGLTRLTINSPQPLQLIPGKSYQTRATLAPPRSLGTPGAFDHAGHLAAEGITISGWVDRPLLIQPVVALSASNDSSWDRFALERFRQRFGNLLRNTLPPEQAGIYQALLIGDYSGIPPGDLERFKATGTIHLLAISGMHLGVVAALCSLLVAWFIKRFPRLLLLAPTRQIALSVTLPLLFLYTGLAGFQTPVMRALIMVTVFIAAMILNRQWSTLNNLAIAGFAILLWNPLDLGTASFQLSFAATTAIVLIAPRLQAWQAGRGDASLRQKATTALLLSMGVSLAAFLATAPLTLFHFNRLSLVGPLATLLLTPPLCLWSLPVGLLAMVCQPLFPAVSALLVRLGSLGIDLSLQLAPLLADLPFANLWLPTPPLVVIFLSLTLAVLILRSDRLQHGAMLLTGFVLLLYGWPPPRHADLRVSFLDVGQGCATVVQLPDNSVTLIDGGGPASDTFDIGERVIAPFLWYNRIRQIDQIIVTHGHADHYNGLPWLIKRFHPHTLWVNDPNGRDPVFRQMLQVANASGCQIRTAHPGEVMAGNPAPDLGIIRCVANLALADHTDSDGAIRERHNANSLGLVLRLDYKETGFLFPGDIEQEDEEQLLKEGAALQATTLLLPHHGLKSSDSPDFLKAVAPSNLIASTAREDRVAIPEPTPESGQHLYITARHGSVFMETDGTRLSVSTWRDQSGGRAHPSRPPD